MRSTERDELTGRDGATPGVARLHLADGVPLPRPEEQVFEAMLDGWRNQQLARNLTLSTVNGRGRKVRAFAAHADAFPWNWSSPLADEWFGDLRAVRGRVRSTLRSYQAAVWLFCDYATDPAYGWAAECERRFGRTGAFRHVVFQAAAPVVARMLGYHDDTSARLAEEAGGTWRHYPQVTTHGDHEPSTAEEYATPDYARSPVLVSSYAPHEYSEVQALVWPGRGPAIG